MSQARFAFVSGAAVALLALVLVRTAAADEHPAQPPRSPASEISPARGDSNWLRAVVEESLALAGGVVWYWLTPSRQLADWDYPSWRDRLTLEAWRFDNNTFATNYLWHSFGGAGFHVFGRSNELGLLPSTALGFATSFAWEYLLEFREKVSVNDVLVTTGSGVAIGEFAYWLGRYLDSSPEPNQPLRAAARWTLGLFHTLHGAMDRRRRAPADSETDRLGFSQGIWHRFVVGYGMARVSAQSGSKSDDDSLVAHQIRIEGDLAALPGYLAPGRLRGTFTNGNLTRLRYRGTFDGYDVDTDFYADTTLLGAHIQDIGEDGSGHAASIGAGVAFVYRRERLGSFSDRLGLLHLPALAYEDHVQGRHFRLSLSVRLNADFAGIESAAYPLFRRDYPDAIEKTILRKQGYYYGWGLSGRLAVELVLPHLALGGSFFGGHYDSQEGLDRSQEGIDYDLDAVDWVEDLQAWVRLGPLMSTAYLEARWLRQLRESEVGGGYQADQSLDRYCLEVHVVF